MPVLPMDWQMGEVMMPHMSASVEPQRPEPQRLPQPQHYSRLDAAVVVVEITCGARWADAILKQYTYGNYLDEVWTLDDRSGGITVADLNDGAGNDRHFYHCNTLYSVYGLTDEAANLVEAYQYDAYGKQTVITDGNDGDTIVNFSGNDVRTVGGNSTVSSPYMYTGQRFDPETGLVYFKNRYMNVDLGRFMSRDPIGYLADRHGLHEYSDSSPVNRIDSIGLVTVSKNKGFGGGSGTWPDQFVPEFLFEDEYDFTLESDKSIGVWQTISIHLRCWDRNRKLIIDNYVWFDEFFSKAQQHGLTDTHFFGFPSLARAETGKFSRFGKDKWTTQTSEICDCLFRIRATAYEITTIWKREKGKKVKVPPPNQWTMYNINQKVREGKEISSWTPDKGPEGDYFGEKTKGTNSVTIDKEWEWRNDNCCGPGQTGGGTRTKGGEYSVVPPSEGSGGK